MSLESRDQVASARILASMAVGALVVCCAEEPAGPAVDPSDTGDSSSQVTSVEILSAVTPEIQVGGTLQLSVEIRDAAGSVLSDRAVLWTSTDPTVATVDNAGVVSGVAEGVASVAAESEGISGVISVTVPPLPPLAVVTGHLFSCALDTERYAHCWGHNFAGKLGNASVDPVQDTLSDVPVAVSGGMRFNDLVAAGSHACGLTPDGEAYCWGYARYGQLGTATPQVCYSINTTPIECSFVPVEVSGGHRFRQLAAGTLPFVCGLTVDRETYCWGSNEYQQLGTESGDLCGPSSVDCSVTPMAVNAAPVFEFISAGLWHVCGVTNDREVYCWGVNQNAVFGNGSTESASEPTPVSNWPVLTRILGGSDFSCGLTLSGQAWCAGDNGLGELGSGTQNNSATPIAVAGGLTFTSLSTQRENSVIGHACGIGTDGAAYCWGANTHGQLGVAQTFGFCSFNQQQLPCNREPIAVTGGIEFEVLSAGNEHTCGRTVSDDVYCWGRNDFGQLGDGTRDDRVAPVRVKM